MHANCKPCFQIGRHIQVKDQVLASGTCSLGFVWFKTELFRSDLACLLAPYPVAPCPISRLRHSPHLLRPRCLTHVALTKRLSAEFSHSLIHAHHIVTLLVEFNRRSSAPTLTISGSLAASGSSCISARCSSFCISAMEGTGTTTV